jgi:hypothetical protein
MAKYVALLTIATLTVAIACGVQSGTATDTAKLPAVIIEMYDAASPNGAIEIEADRDGTIVEIEAGIAIEDLPAKIRKAADKDLPGGKVTGAEIEDIHGTRSWEVQKIIDGLSYEVVYDEDGNLLEKEAEIRREDAPKAVIDAAMGILPGAAFKSVETITKGEETVYHVKVVKDGGSYKFVLAADGKILRKVREAPAEIEIPLK